MFTIDSSNSDRPLWFGLTIEPHAEGEPPRLIGWLIRRGSFGHWIDRPPDSMSAGGAFSAYITKAIDDAADAIRAKEGAVK